MMNKEDCYKSRLCPFSFGLAIGVAKGICMMFYAWAGWLFGYGLAAIHQIGIFYSGFAPSFMGGLWGALHGLVGGFIFGLIVALVYNLCFKCCAKKCGASCSGDKKDA